MVNNEGQIYTMEGIAAAFLMLLTTYIVLSSTTVITPGETHIANMQLETLGNDVLAVMDTPLTFDNAHGRFSQSELEYYIQNNESILFNQTFMELCNKMDGTNDRIKYNASVYFRRSDGTVDSVPFYEYPYYRENAVVVTRWVNIQSGDINTDPARKVPQTVLLEVTLWRE